VAAAPNANSVAVLYFENLSRDSNDTYLADGLTDEIILRLQQVRRLEVKSRYESQRVRGRRNAAPADLGRALATRYLVNGSIQRVGPRIVVRAELTRADRGVGVWSERFDRTSEDILGVIDDVARGVATGVAGQLLPDEAADLTRRPTADPVAYEHYVRGNVYLARRTQVAFARAISEYEAAAARDPSLKVAVARIAYAYALGIALGVGDLSLDSTKARAAAAIGRAMREAPDVPETWMAEGFRDLMRAIFDREDRVSVGVSQLARGVQLGPRNAEAHHQYAQGLAIQGADSAALAEYRTALALEPGRAVSYEETARLLIILDRFPEALAWADSAVTAEPQLVRGWMARARAHLALGDIPAAERDVASAAALNPSGRFASEERSLRAMILVARGDTAQARSVASQVDGFTIFGNEMQVAVGQADLALDDIERQSIGPVLCYRLRFPMLRALRGQPHYDRLAAQCPR
jgi:adenylate cyclase